MRIAIDARMMGAGNTRGIGRYIFETVEALKRQGGHEFVLLQPPIRWYTFAEQLRMPAMLRNANADLVWVPHWNVPLLYRGPLAITIHDLLLLHQPASANASTRGIFVSALKRFGFRLVLANAVRRASVILVPTKAVADDLRSFFPKAESKVVVTGEGISAFTVQNEQRSVQKKNYLFYVGSAYPHKRLDLLLRAWQRLAPTHPDLSLVIAGEGDAFMQGVQALATELNLSRVQFPGRISDAALAEYLSSAVAHVHPSSFEGFALPSLEALSLGCPTIVADLPVMREVLPLHGAFFFNSGDADDMIRAIEAVLRDPDMAREAARQGGEEARRQHDWNKVAIRTLDAFQRVVHVH